jgi:hypothetical protein
MACFSVSVRRTGAHRDIVVAESTLIWWDGRGRQERDLARITLDMPEGPSRDVLARALRALADALDA